MSTTVSHYVRKDDEPPVPRLLSTAESAYVEFDNGALTIFASDPQQLLGIGDAFHTAARLLTRQLATDARNAAVTA